MEKSSSDLNQDQALQVLLQSALVAQRRGAFNLDEAELVAKAFKIFAPIPQPQPQQQQQQQQTQPNQDTLTI